MTIPEVSLRPAHPRDVAQIVRLIEGIADHAKLAAELDATPERLSDCLFGDAPVARALVAESSAQTLVAYAIFFRNFSSFLAKPGLYLEDLYVVPNFRGRGIGTRLFLAVAQIARDEGCGRMEWLALDWNKPALEFYQKLGARCLKDNRLHRLDRDALAALTDE